MHRCEHRALSIQLQCQYNNTACPSGVTLVAQHSLHFRSNTPFVLTLDKHVLVFFQSTFSLFVCFINASLNCTSLNNVCSHSLSYKHSSTSGCISAVVCAIRNDLRMRSWVRSSSFASAFSCFRNRRKYFLVIPRQRWRCSLELADVSRPFVYKYCYTARDLKYNTICIIHYTTTTTATIQLPRLRLQPHCDFFHS